MMKSGSHSCACNTLSSRRKRGPILSELSEGHEHSSQRKRHGVGVPAFAGTTSQGLSRIELISLQARTFDRSPVARPPMAVARGPILLSAHPASGGFCQSVLQLLTGETHHDLRCCTAGWVHPGDLRWTVHMPCFSFRAGTPPVA